MLITLHPMNGAWEKNKVFNWGEYIGENEFECPNCNNTIWGTLSIYEYPVGCFNYEKINDISDSEETEQSEFEEPLVAFYDL